MEAERGLVTVKKHWIGSEQVFSTTTLHSLPRDHGVGLHSHLAAVGQTRLPLSSCPHLPHSIGPKSPGKLHMALPSWGISGPCCSQKWAQTHRHPQGMAKGNEILESLRGQGGIFICVWGGARERDLTVGRSLPTSTPVGAAVKTWLHHQGEWPWAYQVTLHLRTLGPPSENWAQTHFPPHRAIGRNQWVNTP